MLTHPLLYAFVKLETTSSSTPLVSRNKKKIQIIIMASLLSLTCRDAIFLVFSSEPDILREKVT